ncbi:hypothetical protein AL467_06415 [Bartonella bacilliformis]|nr:hypothetical protein AL467_06415 [Bartonella bacilliformis]
MFITGTYHHCFINKARKLLIRKSPLTVVQKLRMTNGFNPYKRCRLLYPFELHQEKHKENNQHYLVVLVFYALQYHLLKFHNKKGE